MNIILDGVSYELELMDEKVEEWSYFEGEIITRLYKCPICGKGVVREIHEDTPGDRDHNMFFDCEYCHKEGRYYKQNPNSMCWWDLVSMTKKKK